MEVPPRLAQSEASHRSGDQGCKTKTQVKVTLKVFSDKNTTGGVVGGLVGGLVGGSVVVGLAVVTGLGG